MFGRCRPFSESQAVIWDDILVSIQDELKSMFQAMDTDRDGQRAQPAMTSGPSGDVLQRDRARV